MKPLYTPEEFKLAKSQDLLPIECYHCEKTFYLKKCEINRILLPNQPRQGNYCSKKCQSISQTTIKDVICNNCGIVFKKQINQIKKSSNHFCSRSCAAKYNNTHKTKGNRRSKLEEYLEAELIKIYPNLEIHFNRKNTINSELDIYIPSLKLAFELNGIFHYEPIFGKNKLNQTTNNDNRKFQACLERGIELCIIDTSQQNYFKIETSQKYLNIICDVINICTSEGV